ncbi:IPT/TIG domain-containing protein [Aquimarina sp. Aq78]|uniref:IPT/TIG domain-containing protein n=1 Tax=Aquimarina sp. Aq78 TaxID=1191889 RepID=UPI00131CFDFB|nr:IPT/TIG domain-containing protein [Aquimarina sp. Aq78]
MKNNSIKILCNLLLCSILFLSCSNDDDNTKPNTEKLNTPPAAFSLIAVADKTEDVELLPTFSWQAATDPDGDTVTYDLYLGAEENPKLYKENIKDTQFEATEELSETTQYYWKVIAKDGNNGTAESGIFSFTTDQAIDVASLSITEGFVGTNIWIKGNGFSEIKEENKVTFNGVEAIVKHASIKSITVIAPDATTGPVVVTVKGVTFETTPLFTYIGDAMSCEDFGKLTVTNFKITDTNELTYEMDMNNTGDGYIDLTNVSVQNYLSKDDQFGNNDDVAAGGSLVSFGIDAIIKPGETRQYKRTPSSNDQDNYDYLIVKIYSRVENCTEETVIIEKIK